MCREKDDACNDAFEDLGSPLRVQGKAVSNSMTPEMFRITPACAGKSSFHVYPFLYNIGSPLRVQGKACSCRNVYAKGRIPPACAGKSDRCNVRAPSN